METESKRAAFEEDLTAKIAWYYYIDNLTQQQIADLIGIPRLRVPWGPGPWEACPALRSTLLLPHSALHGVGLSLPSLET